MIRSHPERTQERLEQLDEYIRKNLLSDGSFICSNFAECRASRCGFPFYEGQMSHVGKHYDLEVDGRPMRIVLVGQEYGHEPKCVDRRTRSNMIAGGSFRTRNPHMRGTTSMLRLLFGREPGYDKEGEQLFPGHAKPHIFEGFSLVNYLLCTALSEPREHKAKGGGKGSSSQIMQDNCARHFYRTLEILEPTVIVAQGKGVRGWMAHALAPKPRATAAESVEIGGREVGLLSFAHPSAGGSYGFYGNSPRSKYLKKTVASTIKTFLRNGSGAAEV